MRTPPSKNRKTPEQAVHNNYYEIPRIIETLHLRPQAYRLYGHIKSVTGEDGVCWENAGTLAKACDISTGTLSVAKQQLAAAGLIVISKELIGKVHVDHIRVVGIWHKNHALWHQESFAEAKIPGPFTPSLVDGVNGNAVKKQAPRRQTTRFTPSNPVAEEQSLENNLYEQSSEAPKNVGKEKNGVAKVNEEFRQQMRDRFSPILGATVDERINEALAHKARLKYTDLQQYIQGWLRRDSERVATTGPPRSGQRSRRVEPNRDPEHFAGGFWGDDK